MGMRPTENEDLDSPAAEGEIARSAPEDKEVDDVAQDTAERTRGALGERSRKKRREMEAPILVDEIPGVKSAISPEDEIDGDVSDLIEPVRVGDSGMDIDEKEIDDLEGEGTGDESPARNHYRGRGRPRNYQFVVKKPTPSAPTARLQLLRESLRRVMRHDGKGKGRWDAGYKQVAFPVEGVARSCKVYWRQKSKKPEPESPQLASSENSRPQALFEAPPKLRTAARNIAEKFAADYFLKDRKYRYVKWGKRFKDRLGVLINVDKNPADGLPVYNIRSNWNNFSRRADKYRQFCAEQIALALGKDKSEVRVAFWDL